MSGDSEAALKSSSIQITTRHERSLYTHLIHILISPWRSHLGRPKKTQPTGSVALTPPKSALRKCDITHHTICDINVYDIRTKTTAVTQDCRKRIYYFCGGGWQSPPSGQHWQMCVRMARDLPGTAVCLVSYPHAPKNPAPLAFPWLLTFYRTIMQKASEVGEKVILAGDSSGGNVVLCLTLEALREDAEGNSEEKSNLHPVALLTTCPSTDLTRSNPDIEKLAKRDPILTPKFVKSTASRWTGDWDAADPRVSPVNADISLLAKSGIHVHGVSAGHDILSPDGIIFRDLCAKAGVQGQWLHWEKQMHCFCLTAGYGVPEAKQAVDWSMDILRNE
jgi:acetyl esterase/lipase